MGWGMGGEGEGGKKGISPLQCRGQDSDGGVGGTEKMCTLHEGGMLWFLSLVSLANRSMSIQDLFVGPFPIPRFIKE
jgi:hypothetical protein